MADPADPHGHPHEHAHAPRTGVMRWLTTTDHKEIGIMYLWTAFFFFIVGGILALLMRWELATAGPTDLKVLGMTLYRSDPQTFNEFFGMHATVMIFLWVMPAMAGLGNYLVPIMIKAPDMAFPRINALSYWLIPPAGLILFAAPFVPESVTQAAFERTNGLMDVAWVGYPPLSAMNPSFGIDLWLVTLILLGTASTLGAVNFLTTIIKMRAPDVTFHNMPLFVWAQFTTSLLLLFATPVLTVALILLLLDRNFGTSFFINDGGSAILWQHLFWFFGHPEVYILIMPAMGIISEVIPKFSGRPIFGYRSMAYAILAIGFLGFIVWAHHMFTTGMDPRVRAAFMINTMIIGVPTGVKIFNWIATMWGGKIDFQPPMLFAIGFVSMFIIGGIDGVFSASIPVDYALHDTYWVVGHIHYVLFGGSVLGIFAGVYYWFPRMSGRMYNKKLAYGHFWLTLISLNLVFMVMHNLGADGMPRRVYDYREMYEGMNYFATVGAFALGAAQILFFANILWAVFKGPRVHSDPWGGLERTEWVIWPRTPPGHPVAHADAPPGSGAAPGADVKEGA